MALSGYGRLYVEAGVTAQTLNATPGTFNQMTGFATDGISLNTTVANGTDNVKVSAAGDTTMPIHAHFSVSFTVGAAGLYRIAVYKDGTVIPGSERRIKCSLTTDYTVSGHVITTATEGTSPTFDIRLASDQVSPAFTPTYASFEVWQ